MTLKMNIDVGIADFCHKISGIPAGVLLAQCAWETGWGRSKLFVDANNCFGIRVANNVGDCMIDDVQTWDGAAYETVSNGSFRKYDHVLFSFLDRVRLNFTSKYIKSLDFLFDQDLEGYMRTVGRIYAPNSYVGKSKLTYDENWMSIYQRHFATYDSPPFEPNMIPWFGREYEDGYKAVLWLGANEQIIKDVKNA